MFFEFRQYTIFEGKMQEWVQYMEGVIIPMQIARGMVVVGSFVDEQDPNTYYWIRRFDSEEQRVELYKAVYESEEWVKTVGPRVGELIDRSKIVVKRITPTPHSVLR